MTKDRAIKRAFELTTAYLNACNINMVPQEIHAKNLADFVETLVARFEKMGDEKED